MKKRHPALLLEMIIAMIIMASAIGLLFAGFYDAIQAKNFVKKEREKVLDQQRLQKYFARLFRDVMHVEALSDQRYYIKYKGGIDPDSSFRSDVEALLQLKNKTLTLIAWPLQGKPRELILIENTDSLKIEFFDEKKGSFEYKYPEHKPRMMIVYVNGKPLPLFL